MTKLFLSLLLTLSLEHLAFSAPADEISSFALFQKEALQKLPPGEVLTTKPPLMAFERGLAVETCFLAPFPLEKVRDNFKNWNQTLYPDLGVYLQGAITQTSSPELERLVFNPSLKPVKKLMEKTADARANDCPLHLSKTEVTSLSELSADKLLPETATSLWKKLLTKRLADYTDGGLASLSPYDAGRPPIQTLSEFNSLFQELPAVSNRFAPLLDAARSGKSEGTPYHYWQLINVDGTAVLCLGSIYTREVPETGATQLLDLQWYVSGGYYVSATCMELYPIQAGKTPATLIWRGDYTAISMKQIRKGMERLFSVNIMLQEVKKSIRFFLQDLAQSKS